LEQSMIGRRDNSSESWKTLPWKKFRRNLFGV
jgi:RNA-directed DNA polymerase